MTTQPAEATQPPKLRAGDLAWLVTAQRSPQLVVVVELCCSQASWGEQYAMIDNLTDQRPYAVRLCDLRPAKVVAPNGDLVTWNFARQEAREVNP